MIAGLERKKTRGRRRHAGGEQHRVRALLQRGQHGFRLVVGGIVGADIIASRTVLIVRIADDRWTTYGSAAKPPCVFFVDPAEACAAMVAGC